MLERKQQMDINNNTRTEFILNFQGEMANYLINVENSMIGLLRLYVSIFMIFGPALTFLQARYGVDTLVISLLLLIIFFLGLYILAMYLELRIRKIKVIEQIAIVRSKIKDKSDINKWIKMPKSIEECPPYLRRPSSEWYTVIFLCFLNGIAVTLGLFFFILRYNLSIVLLVIICAISFMLVFIYQFWWATRYTHNYDLKCEDEYETTKKYKLLDPHPYFPGIFKILNSIAKCVESEFKKWYNNNCLEVKKRFEDYNKIECEFCKIGNLKKDMVTEDKYFFIKRDSHPVSKGHTLVIPKRHICSLLELKRKEAESLYSMLKRAKAIIQKNYGPNGFNFGVNEGKAGGQTIEHLHIHIIPRYKGDVESPEGGVRNIIPGKGKYKA